MKKRLFRYYPEDFGALPMKVLHMDLCFDVYDDHARVFSDLTAESLDASLTTLAINAKNLEIHSVGINGRTLTYAYKKEQNLLQIIFQPAIPPHTRFTLHTDITCYPSRTILEGLYYDVTPTRSTSSAYHPVPAVGIPAAGPLYR
ncbi:MAG: hypothetical protein LUP99_01070 [Methanomicrobiales archaeon]|nr:hypothetical protein [Methanomicrobiales archaeon]